MRRVLFLLILLAGSLVAAVAAPGASAQPTLDEVVADIVDQGFYVEPGEPVDIGDLTNAIAEHGDSVVIVVLANDDPDGNDFAAAQVATDLGDGRAVLVLSPNDIGATGDFSDEEIDIALEAVLVAIDDNDGTYGDAVRAFDNSLQGQSTIAATTAPTVADASSGVDTSASSTASDGSATNSGGGGKGLLIFVLVVAAIIGGFWFLSKRKAKTIDDGEVERARTEIKSQLEVIAHEIVEQEDEIELRGNDEAIAFFREANATYSEVSEAVDTTTNLVELAELNDEVDEARWQLEAAAAIMDGRPVPPEPEPEKPVACFFDPTHKPGSEECVLRTEAGEKEVRVCGECADKLKRGEQPKPRMIDVRGRQVPAAKAPRSHGGLGMGGLSAFEVILGGLGALARGGLGGGSRSGSGRSSGGGGLGIDWGGGNQRQRQAPRRRSPGGVFDTDRTPPRGSLPRTPASRPPRSRGSRSSASGRGSARRRRR